ncbi:hypothetical protein N7U66_09945 [Lacinutrix neustonica]|uniref:Uncharacterized protein n=1 Tax=Lacinutrix neustonica TaxID=2980107 RepID=A0A9E8MZG0_9FLAO|nr:hypothetical protein [Lacinutrix neustonica]WAC03714.1 hypothetical protein N7U66_09945 [Lacinutrix neustonica]
MNNSKKSKKTVRQNEKFLPKSQKHDVNLRKNSTLYFQIGLIVCLPASYTALEMTFASANYSYIAPEPLKDVLYVADAKTYKAEENIVDKWPSRKEQHQRIRI